MTTQDLNHMYEKMIVNKADMLRNAIMDSFEKLAVKGAFEEKPKPLINMTKEQL